MYKYYLRLNDDNHIIKVFSDAFEKPLETDILYKESSERIFTMNLTSNIELKPQYKYQYENNEIVERTHQDLSTNLTKESIEYEKSIIKIPVKDISYFEGCYQKGDPPWITNCPSDGLIELITKYEIKSCKAFEIGCGYGFNAIWMAQQGFTVDAADFSPTAISKAIEKSTSTGTIINFQVSDFRDYTFKDKYELFYDVNVLYYNKDFISQFAKIAYDNLADKGYWITIFHSDLDTNIKYNRIVPALSKDYIQTITHDFFNEIEISDDYISELAEPFRVWKCIFQKK